LDAHEFEKYRRILEWFRGNPQPPFKIDIELHRRCNLRCLSCSRRSSPDYERLNEISKELEMPLEKWLRIVEEAAELGVKEWHIAGGGEPMFLPEVTIPVMKKIKEYGMLGIITTNGTLWTRKIIETVVKIGWDRIHFSIDGPNSKIHDYLRQVPGTFRRVVKTLNMLNKFKEKYKTDKPMINMNTVLSIKNYKLLPEMVKFAKKHKIEFMFIEPLIVYSKYGEKLKLKKKHLQEFPKYLKKAIELAKKFNIHNNFIGLERNLDPELIQKSSKMNEIVEKDMEEMKKLKVKGFLSKFLTVPCYKPWFHMTIKCEGRVTSCDVPVFGGENIRNKTIKEIWFKGEYFRKLRRMLKSRKIPEFCAQCNPSHTSQRRRMRLEILKTINPKLYEKVKALYEYKFNR